jgi:putative endonuclease
MSTYFVYILANKTRTLYVGVTNDLVRRVHEHRERATPGFTSRYRVNRLVYFQPATEISAAIDREKEIKGWVRRKKVEMIEAANPDWRDLAEDLGFEPLDRAVNRAKSRIADAAR